MESDNVERDNYMLGVDIDGARSAILLAGTGRKKTDGTESLERYVVPIKGGWQEVLGTLALYGGEMVKHHDILPNGCVIGTSYGGPLDSGSGVILFSPNFPGWDEAPITERMGQKLGMPARLRNDADTYVLAEWRYGVGQGCRHMILLIFGTGLGAELVLNGRSYQGAYDMAGEAGHTRLDQDRPVGYGKAGSFGGFCSDGEITQLVRRMAAEAFKEEKNASYSRKKGLDFITAKDVAEATECGIEDALQVYECLGRYFGHGLAILINILNSERIVVGNIFVRSGKLMGEEMERKLRKEALSESPAVCTIVPATPGDRIGDHGVVVAALE